MALLESSDKVIRTARLVLRPLREGDNARIFALFANGRVLRFLSSPPPASQYTLEDAREFVRVRSGEMQTITVAITRDDGLMGITDLIVKPESALQRDRGYLLGYWLGEPYWGRGYMTEAVRAFLAQAFTRISDDTIYSGAYAGNLASLRIQEKLGFVRDSEAMLFSRPNGKEMPHVATSVTRAGFAGLSR